MNVVLTRLDRIGDLVLSTPAIASVRRSWPQARITMVCSAYNAVVMEGNRDVDEVVAIPRNVRPAVVAERYRGAFDLAFALAPCAPDFTFVAETRARRRIGYTYVRRYLARLSAPLFLTECLVSEADPELCERDPAYVVRHEVEQVRDLVRAAGGETLADELVVPVSAETRARVAHVPEGSIVVHLAPRWLAAGSTYESLVALLWAMRRFGRPVVVTHGPDVAAEAATLRAGGVADLVLGGLAFHEWAATFERAAVVVTVDTGATHVASAMHRPTLVLFERRYFALSSQEWAPYRVPSVCLRKPAGETPAELAASREEILAGIERLLQTSDA
jgi:ADP-heptose:LPS heptosyltransferase